MIIPTIDYQEKLWKEGYFQIAGVDEVGRGPLAGPVLAGAVVIHSKEQIVSIVRDSKLMSRKQRNDAFKLLCEKSSAYGIGEVDAREIDKIGIHVATKKAMIQALEQIEKRLGKKLDYVLVDGSKTLPLENYRSERILRGGLYHYSIAAASVLAKVIRDKLMEKFSDLYPQYNFEKHVGYGTSEHLKKLKMHGPCPIHRLSFKPVSNLS